MSDNDTPPPLDAVVSGRTAQSPEPASANSLKLTLVAGGTPQAPPLMLHGYYNLASSLAGRYSGSLPQPVYCVAVSRKTGRVHIQRLLQPDDIPPIYLGDAAPPKVALKLPGGGLSAKGISESGYFSVDLKRHLGLADAADTYDVFLWLEDVASEVVSAAKPAETGTFPGSLLYDRSAVIATIRGAAASDALELVVWRSEGDRYLAGRSGINLVSVVACGVASGQAGWTVFQVEGTGGMEFQMKLRDLLPGIEPEERVVAFALAGGRRSPLADTGAKK